MVCKDILCSYEQSKVIGLGEIWRPNSEHSANGKLWVVGRTKDGGRGLTGSIATGRLLCKKGDETKSRSQLTNFLETCAAYIENIG
jgi:hypothetical protein